MKLKFKKMLSLFLVIAMLSFAGASITASADTVKVNDLDTDGDGLSDEEENATDSKTDWDDPDTDGDGLIDSYDDRPDDPDGKILQYDEEGFDKLEAGDNLINTFLFVLLLSFAVFSLLAGIFTAYFGAGKSRAIGAVLLLLGLVIIVIWIWFGILSEYPDDTLLGVIHWEAARTMEAFVTVISAIIGAVIAVVLFLVAIMKS